MNSINLPNGFSVMIVSLWTLINYSDPLQISLGTTNHFSKLKAWASLMFKINVNIICQW